MSRIFPRLLLLSVIFLIFGLLSFDALAGGSKLGLDDPPANQAQAQPTTSDNPLVNAANGTQAPPPREPGPLGFEALTILGRLLLAGGLSSIVAFRPRQDVPLFKRSLF